MRIQEITLQKAILLLKSLNCQYAIIDANGKTHGNLKLTDNKQKEPTNLFIHGEITHYVKEYLINLTMGDVVQIPFGKFSRKSLASSACNWMRTQYGRDSYTSHMNKETKCIEILRIN